MLGRRLDELTGVIERRDGEAFEAVVGAVWTAAQDADPAQLNPALARIGALLEGIPYEVAGRLAILGGALVEIGADETPLVAEVTAGLIEGLQRSAVFIDSWPEGMERPDPDGDAAAYDAAVEVLNRTHSEEDAHALVHGWFTLSAWVCPATALLQSPDVRAGLPNRDLVMSLVNQIAPLREDLGFLSDLLSVLDNETLIVLHRPTGLGYEITISGVGGNFQLHTLLAATVSGRNADGLIRGVRPKPSWIAAATDGPAQPAGGVKGQFNMVDGTGSWIWGEGKPADIPLLHGRRVVVLEPSPYERSWNTGRIFERMRPDIRLERILPQGEAAGWLMRVTKQ